MHSDKNVLLSSTCPELYAHHSTSKAEGTSSRRHAGMEEEETAAAFFPLTSKETRTDKERRLGLVSLTDA